MNCCLNLRLKGRCSIPFTSSLPLPPTPQILVSYLQVAAIVKTINLQWPSFVNTLLNAFKQINVSSATASTGVSLDCSLMSDYPPK